MSRALDPFFAFAAALRAAGFPVAPDQTQGFIAAVGALGPRGINDVYTAALALFAIPPERRAEFDALFQAVFAGQTIAAPTDSGAEDVEALEPTGDQTEIELDEGQEPTGEDATAAERLSHRSVADRADRALAAFVREAPKRLPRRLSYRRARAKRGDRIDLRRALRLAARQEGEVFYLPQTRRKTRQRKIVLLVDVSGSMKECSDANLRLAHSLVQVAARAEVFTLGTRLTRLTTALAPANPASALLRAGQPLSDLDGGTRLGEALTAFLSVPRYAGFARGALVVVLSDGLEQGDPAGMADATARLSRLAWRLHWLTPLAADPSYRPVTAGIQAILPFLDELQDGAAIPAICTHLLNVARAA